MQIFSSVKKHSAFTLTELIVVITILSILSVIGFVVMSHQSSVARDGKRISDIKTLSESARITSAQLRKLPTPIADSVSLSVSGSFIGYQGFMSLALVNPLGYGSDKIFDPKDNIPYTYRVNQHYDQAQFMAYLENPRFERSIEIAKQSLPSHTSGNLFASLREAIPDISLLSSAHALDTAYALDSSSVDLSVRYPYSAGDRLGIFLSKNSKQPLQNGVTGTGSRDISLSDVSTLDIIVGSQGADEYVSTDISTGSLNALKDGSFDEKSLLGMNMSGSGGESSGSGGGTVGGGGGSSCSVNNPTPEQYFTFNSSTHTITDYDGVNGPKNVVIPCEIGGVVVESIGGGAFLSNELTSVTISSNVTNIGDSAFYGNQIHTLNLGNGVYSIGNYAFGSNQITTLSLPDSTVEIGNNAFYYNQIHTLEFGTLITHINNYVFYGNNLTSFSIPSNITHIGVGAFYDNNISTLDLTSNNLEIIGNEAFGVNGIQNLTISSVNTIGNYAFAWQYKTSGNGTVYGPSSGYIKDTYINNINGEFDKNKLPNYIDAP